MVVNWLSLGKVNLNEEITLAQARGMSQQISAKNQIDPARLNDIFEQMRINTESLPLPEEVTQHRKSLMNEQGLSSMIKSSLVETMKNRIMELKEKMDKQDKENGEKTDKVDTRQGKKNKK